MISKQFCKAFLMRGKEGNELPYSYHGYCSSTGIRTWERGVYGKFVCLEYELILSSPPTP